MRTIKIITLIFAFFAVTSIAKAQIVLEDHKDFFQSQVINYKNWFNSLNISDTVLSISNLDIFSDKLVLNLKMKDYHNWKRLTDKFQTNCKDSIYELLFNKLIFVMDLQTYKDLVEIDIEGIDVFVFIKYKNDKVVAEIQKKMGEISDNVNLEIGDIKYIPNSEKTISKKTMSKIQDILTTELEKYLITNKVKTSWSEPVFETYRYPNEFLIEISNVTKMIIPNNSYWERAVITFTFIEENDKMTIKYSILGKYASGPTWVPWEPFKTDYYDMEQKYSDELKKFGYKLSSKVTKLLTD